MNSTPLKVVHVGCGAMAGAWLQPAASLPEVEIVGFVDLQIESARKRRDEFAPRASIGSDLAEMLNQTKPDIVFNCTAPEAHHAVSKQALLAGAHVLSEKPLANSMAEAKDLVEIARKAGLHFAVTQNYRYQPTVRTLVDTCEQGTIGQITGINCDFYLGAHFGGFRDQMGHVLLLDMAIHHFDLARLFARDRPSRVFCREWNPSGSWYRHGANAHAIFEFDNEVVFNYRGSWCAEGTSTDWNGSWRVQGDLGSLLWDGGDSLLVETVASLGGFVSETVRRPVPATPHAGRDQRHGSIIREFIHAVRNDMIPETVAADNIHSLAMVFAAINSAETAAVVPVSF